MIFKLFWTHYLLVKLSSCIKMKCALEFWKNMEYLKTNRKDNCMNLHKLILTENACYKTGRKITPKGIMVHSTGANNPNLRRYVGPDDGKIYKNGSDLWDREEFNPKNSPELWSEIMYREGIRIIPDKIEYATRFAKDELGWRGNDLWQSLQNDNVYTPEEYLDYWKLIKKGDANGEL